ncbi:HypC/HybG/HupF family hydrogenase formation chaperone [Desulfothermus sp.]
MCIAVPLRVEKIEDEVVYCKVGEGTVQASLLLMDEEVKVGDYVLIHAGFAIRRLEEEDAKQTLDLINEALQPS